MNEDFSQATANDDSISNLFGGASNAYCDQNNIRNYDSENEEFPHDDFLNN